MKKNGKLIGIGPFTAKVNYHEHPIKEDQTLEEFVKEKSDKKFPIPAEGQNPMQFIQQQINDTAKRMLQDRIAATKKDYYLEKTGRNLYIVDTIYDVWPDDETKGKSAKLIAEIFQGKIKDYSRIHEEYEYERAEYNYFPNGIMRFVIHFIKK